MFLGIDGLCAIGCLLSLVSVGFLIGVGCLICGVLYFACFCGVDLIWLILCLGCVTC